MLQYEQDREPGGPPDECRGGGLAVREGNQITFTAPGHAPAGRARAHLEAGDAHDRGAVFTTNREEPPTGSTPAPWGPPDNTRTRQCG